VFGHSISPWNNELRTGVEWLRRAFDAGEQTGDLTFAAYARNDPPPRKREPVQRP
jgi:hypothetical protein